uniref:CSON014352 protein n=1 Tax=Culicoides sonorensis TaxID=179676 RepID=A0A336MAJ0_CULSO
MSDWPKTPRPGSSARKKWNLEDRDAVQNQIKYRFAEEGHVEMQFSLAQNLLNEDSDVSDPDNHGNHAQAINWLIRAASQGHDEAYNLLADCYRDGKGINENNEAAVCECLNMSQGERSARKAAKEVFQYLSNGEEYISVQQLEKKLREIYKLDKKRSTRHDIHSNGISPASIAGSSSHHHLNGDGHRNLSASPIHYNVSGSPSYRNADNGNISEANLVSAAIHYAHGHLPFEDQQIVISVPHPDTLDHIPCFHRPFFNPMMFFLLLYHRFVAILSTLPGSIYSNLQLIIALIGYCLYTMDNFTKYLPLGVYYLTFLIMTVSTFKMLKTKHEFVDFRLWSGLFLRYGDQHVDAEESENRFLRNNLSPYFVFFIAFVVNLITYPFISNHWLPNSELTVISFIMTFMTLLAFMYTSSDIHPDYTILFSFGLNVLAKYPYEMDSVVTTGWRFLDLKVPAFTTFVIGNGIEFCINCRALLYLTIPAMLLYLAHRDNWRGAFRYLIPHCVTLSWLQICIVSSQSATMFGLVRAALGLSGMLLFLPLFGIATLLIPVFAAIEWLSLTDPTIRLMSSVIATVFLTFPYMTNDFESHSKSKLFDSHGIDVDLKTQPRSMLIDDLPANPLTWDQFYKYCNKPAWEKVTKVKTQLRCSHLDGTVIHWEGSFADIEITKVKNFRADLIKFIFPDFLGNAIACFYGDENKDGCKIGEECDEIKKLLKDEPRCNLDKWNTYEYGITMHMSSGLLKKPVDAFLKASHSFGNFTERLHNMDRLWFQGTLRTSLSNLNEPKEKHFTSILPFIEVTSIGCIQCEDKKLEAVILPEGLKISARLRDLSRGVKYLLNVLFNPLVTFK